VTGRLTSPDDLGSADQPIAFVIDDDESMHRALTNLFQSVGLRVEVFGSAPNCCGASFRMRGRGSAQVVRTLVALAR
jgi:FixJ family two-component response regulator